MSNPNTPRIVSILLACLTLCLAVQAAEAPPPAPKRPVKTTYFGTSFTDNYHYMENLEDKEVQAWMKAQDHYTRDELERIPGRPALEKRLQSLVGGDLRRSEFVRRGDRLFYQVLEPGADLQKLAYRDGVKGQEHILVDPATLSKDKSKHFALDWYSPSWDGSFVAYGLSEGGSEHSVLHLLDLKKGKPLAEQIDRTDSCVVSWRPDNQSFFYLRYPKPGPDTPASQTVYNAVTFVHTLGQNPHGDGDQAVFGRGVSSSVEVPEGQGTYIVLAEDSPYAIAVANHNMDSNPNTNTFYVAPLDRVHGADTPWQRFATPDSGVADVQAHGDRLYVLQSGKSRFRVLSTPADHPELDHAQILVPEGDAVLDSFAIAGDALYLSARAGAAFQLQRVGFDGEDLHTIALPFSGTIANLTADAHKPGVMLHLQGWVTSARELIYDPQTSVAADSGLIPPAGTESPDYEAREEFAVSYDGTRIPISIIARKGTARDGSHPALVTGYGSLGISEDPSFDSARIAWLERGGVIAVVHVRGGGEYGDAWHHAGLKRQKINSMLDFNAGAQYLIDQHYTQSRYLVANAASAGGILMNGALTLNSSLFRVVLDDVGMSDLLRYEIEPNGPPNVPEFGSTSNEDGFHALYSMSAYEHIHDGTPYPAVMFTTGANDPRVASWHLLKMTARVQDATSSGRPVLLRVDYDAGHGFGSGLSQKARLLADEMSFAFWQLGLPDFQPPKSAASD